MLHRNDLAHRAHRSRHVEHEGPRIRGNADRNRVRADQRFRSAKGMNEHFRRREGDADESFQRAAFGVIADHSDMRGIADRQHGDAMLPDGRGQLAKTEFADGCAESVLPVDIENRAGGPGLFGLGVDLQQPLLNAGDHDGQPLDTVGMNPPEIGFRPDIGLDEGFLLIRAQSAKDRDDADPFVVCE